MCAASPGLGIPRRATLHHSASQRPKTGRRHTSTKGARSDPQLKGSSLSSWIQPLPTATTLQAQGGRSGAWQLPVSNGKLAAPVTPANVRHARRPWQPPSKSPRGAECTARGAPCRKLDLIWGCVIGCQAAKEEQQAWQSETAQNAYTAGGPGMSSALALQPRSRPYIVALSGSCHASVPSGMPAALSTAQACCGVRLGSPPLSRRAPSSAPITTYSRGGAAIDAGPTNAAPTRRQHSQPAGAACQTGIQYRRNVIMGRNFVL